eukprot:GFKZ01000381.1.p1 GENE.GFKZ01000381.1~~GFKZ01000381.1.p1  ORF type:complete len:232 (+),score=2.14 GFKZ01000381.1:553-1248(+)
MSPSSSRGTQASLEQTTSNHPSPSSPSPTQDNGHVRTPAIRPASCPKCPPCPPCPPCYPISKVREEISVQREAKDSPEDTNNNTFDSRNTASAVPEADEFDSGNRESVVQGSDDGKQTLSSPPSSGEAFNRTSSSADSSKSVPPPSQGSSSTARGSKECTKRRSRKRCKGRKKLASESQKHGPASEQSGDGNVPDVSNASASERQRRAKRCPQCPPCPPCPPCPEGWTRDY